MRPLVGSLLPAFRVEQRFEWEKAKDLSNFKLDVGTGPVRGMRHFAVHVVNLDGASFFWRRGLHVRGRVGAQLVNTLGRWFG